MSECIREDSLLPISALQHWLFCPRQCALIHLEQAWSENALTAKGRRLHEKVHAETTENRPGIRIVRSLWLQSQRLGLIGVADVVEFHKETTGIRLPETQGFWQPHPVEYKRGRPKRNDCDRVQLCAQAMCLEEMLDVTITDGALFYGRPRRRENVPFDHRLRLSTEQAAAAVRSLFESGHTPRARYEKKCRSCSLLRICMPRVTGPARQVARYVAKAMETSEQEDVS